MNKIMCHVNYSHLTLKRQIKIAADDTLIFLLLFLEENKAWSFMWILCLAEDSHKISSLIFSEKKKKEKVFMNVVCCSRDSGFKG